MSKPKVLPGAGTSIGSERQLEMTDDTEERSPGTKRVESVRRAVELLRVLGDSAKDMTLAELAEETNLPRSTVHRIVQTLHDAHFVADGGGDGGLRLGPEFARLSASSRQSLIPTVRPFLEALAQRLSEGASLTVLEGMQVRFLDQAIVGQGLRAVTLVGTTFPAHCTANGKVLLAALPRPVLETMLPEELASRTYNTITDRESLLRELDVVSTEGVAYDREEHELGVSAVAALVIDDSGNRAAISSAMPTPHFNDREEELGEIVKATARDASTALGWTGD